MGLSADVKSHESIEHFRHAMMEFQDACKKAITLLETEKFQAFQWLEYDMPTFWKKQARIRYDEISEARNRLRSCEMRGAVGDKKPSCIEEKKDLERAKKRQEFAQRMIQVVRKWSIKVHKDGDEFTGRIGRCKAVIDNDVTYAIVLLKRMVEALEKYLSMSAPSDTSIQIQRIASLMQQPVDEETQEETTRDEEVEGEAGDQPPVETEEEGEQA